LARRIAGNRVAVPLMSMRKLQSAVAVILAVLLPVAGTASEAPAPQLDRGFHLLYNLDFAAAQKEFAEWQRLHPDDPMGPVAEAAGMLFSEFDRLGVLETQLFVRDSSFSDKQKFMPDPDLRARFERALERGESLAIERLAANENDRDALLAMTLSEGLQADYASLIDKSNLKALSYTRQATQWADRLLAVDPECYDAYLATGISKYIVGSLVAPLRWVLRLDGYRGNKKEGMAEVAITAERGRYLKPFARVLLAVAHLREKDIAQARALLTGLRDEFPANPLFARELARLEKDPSCKNC